MTVDITPVCLSVSPTDWPLSLSWIVTGLGPANLYIQMLWFAKPTVKNPPLNTINDLAPLHSGVLSEGIHSHCVCAAGQPLLPITRLQLAANGCSPLCCQLQQRMMQRLWSQG